MPSELKEAERLVCLEVHKYLAEDPHWQAAAEWPSGTTTPTGVLWPPPASSRWCWCIRAVAEEYAWNTGHFEYFRSMGEIQGSPRNLDHAHLPCCRWIDDLSDPRHQRLVRVVDASVRHAMQCFHGHYGSAYLAGARKRAAAENERAFGAAMAAGLNVEDAARAVGLSRAQGFRIAQRKPPVTEARRAGGGAAEDSSRHIDSGRDIAR